MTWFFNLIIGLGTLIVGLLAFSDEIASKISYAKGLRSLFFKVPILILGSFMIIIGTILKDNESDDRQEEGKNAYVEKLDEMEKNYRNELKVSDSLNNKKIQESIDSSYQKSMKASNEALAKYNLTLI
ncbi:MAG TPA: hypothetical protein VFI06_14060, partial [Chitinophagaceae bacterium]|nr:hypothetical protein [Chitinophagaceae bacterium]